jgi:hypothetical protein
VERWIETHWSKIFTKYRDKRAAIIKLLRKEVGILLNASPMPFKGGQEAMVAWRVKVSRAWNIYNVSVCKDGKIKIPQSFKKLAADLLERMEKIHEYEKTPAVFIAFLWTVCEVSFESSGSLPVNELTCFVDTITKVIDML